MVDVNDVSENFRKAGCTGGRAFKMHRVKNGCFCGLPDILILMQRLQKPSQREFGGLHSKSL